MRVILQTDAKIGIVRIALSGGRRTNGPDRDETNGK